jgi:putative NADH-flavin reductase
VKVTLFGATGSVGGECAQQCLERGHEVVVSARTPSKLPAKLRERVTVVHGDGLDANHVDRVLREGSDGVLFAIGIDRHSPEDLCTHVTRNIIDAMPRHGVRRLVWCGGGSTIVEQDQVTIGAKFVELFARTFMGLRHRDKQHQLELLAAARDIDWLGVRPLQLRSGPRRGVYRLGFDAYSGLSKVSFADCADAMIGMLDDDTWLRKAPIIQY